MKGSAFLLVLGFSLVTVRAQEGNDDDVAPAPPSIGADVPLSYFGPAPSQVQRELIGPFQLLKSGQVDLDKGEVTIPLYEGYYDDGTKHYYVLTDTSDAANAAALGLNHSPKIIYANGRAVDAVVLRGNKVFNRTGKVDFAPERFVVPADEPAPFPPTNFSAGSIGDSRYTPLIRLRNLGRNVYNAPIVADGDPDFDLNQFCDGIPERKKEEAFKYIHNKVVAICPREATVTIRLVPGFSFARPVLYLTMDSNNPMVAALEDINLAPGLNAIVTGVDDTAFSAVERLFTMINGPSNVDIPEGLDLENHPYRQGQISAIRGEGPTLNVLGGIPTIATDYSPMWDVNVGEWSPAAVEGNLRIRVLEEFQILGLVEQGLITGPGGGPYGSNDLIVNCPIVFRFL